MKHILWLAPCMVFLGVSTIRAAAPSPKEIAIQPHPGNQVPLDITFRDEAGEDVELGHYFRDKPVVLVLAYYRCPRLCTEVLNDLSKGLRGVAYTPGKDFQIVVVSFDAREKPDLAAAKKSSYVEDYGRPGTENGWHFLTGDQSSIDELKEAVGFKAVYDPKEDQFAHDSAVMVLTPDGKMSRYLFGLGYKPRDLRLALVESSEGKIGSTLDHILLMCFHYDAMTGKYSATALSIIRIGGILTLLALVGFWVISMRREQRLSGRPLAG